MQIIIQADSAYYSEEDPPTDKTATEEERTEGAGDEVGPKESSEKEPEIEPHEESIQGDESANNSISWAIS